MRLRGGPNTKNDPVAGQALKRDGRLSAWFLAGSTASGKSAVALGLAERIGGEIVSVDSMQVYRGLDIGTAKPSPEERRRVPHHLVDVVELSETFDAARWLALARAAFAEIRGRGRIPLFCGGTGLYFSAWFHGLNEIPPVRASLRAEIEDTPLLELLQELERKDPASLERIDRQNPRRVRRAIEILRGSGRPPSELRRMSVAGEPARVVVLNREPGDLRHRVDTRVDAMFTAGLVEETRSLLAVGLGENRTAMQALGYRQVIEHLRGARDLDATRALVKTRTWQFARRQRTWFRHQLAADWLEIPPGEPPSATVERLLEVRR